MQPSHHHAERPTRGHKKKLRTRLQLIEAGLRVLAVKGEALVISDVTDEAGVSNGTFYNYFSDRDALIDALAKHSIVVLGAEAAVGMSEDDPARRFARATTTVLRRVEADPTWGRVVLRLADHRFSFDREIIRYLREDLRSGLDSGRFTVGDDEITLDAVVGFVAMAVRRIVRGEAGFDYVPAVVGRMLMMLGVSADEAEGLATGVQT